MANLTSTPKGILKKSGASVPEPDDRARAVAVQHAAIIHDRLLLSDTISDSIISLAKLPSSPLPPHTASSPSSEDAEAFKSQVRLFQPSDYEDLIEERNCLGRCGYVLCPKPRMRVKQSGEFKLVNYGRSDFSIVPKKEIERWCSQACARRAMYVKVQLNETAAWERAGIEGIKIDLYEEPNKPKQDDAAGRLAEDLQKLRVEADIKSLRDARELALERGDVGDQETKRSVEFKVQENAIKRSPENPSLQDGNGGHLLLEGHKTKFDALSRRVTTKAVERGLPAVRAKGQW